MRLVTFGCSHTFGAGLSDVNCRSSVHDGQGILTLSSGNKYEGEYKDGLKNGQGMYTYSNGDKYVGEFKYDKPHGHGTFTYSDGRKYVGEWKSGNQHGQGTFFWSNGDKYVGEFEGGVPTITSPSRFAWPQLLANKFKIDIECLNKAHGGASNDDIFNLILNFDFQQDDIVIILWTFVSRISIFRENGERYRIRKFDAPKTYNKSNTYYKYFYQEADAMRNLCIKANYTQYCLHRQVKILKQSYIQQHNNFNFPSWNNVNFFDNDIDASSNDKGLDGVHPGPKSHEMFADNLYLDLKK